MSLTVATQGSPESIAMNALILSQAAASGSQADLCAAIMDMVNKVNGIIPAYMEEIKVLKSQNATLEERLQQNLVASTAREEAMRGEIGALSQSLTRVETEVVGLRQQISATNQTATAALAKANNHTHSVTLPTIQEAYIYRAYGTSGPQ